MTWPTATLVEEVCSSEIVIHPHYTTWCHNGARYNMNDNTGVHFITKHFVM